MDDTPAPPALPPTPAGISVIDPISQAMSWTGRVLFKPFDIGKWFVLGFCAWLAWIGQGGGGGGGSNWNIPSDDPSRGTRAAMDWIDAHMAMLIVIAAISTVLIIGLIVLFTWLSSRGKLMFLDGVVHNRGAVVEPWHRYRMQGNSLFLFRLAIGLIALVVFGVLVALAAVSLIGMGISEVDFPPAAILVLCFWIAVIIGVAIVFGLISVAVNDVVVPIMWLRGNRVMDAWSEFWALFSAHTGTFVLYVLMKIVLAIVIGIIALVATCLTCCIAALPYIGTVILLPLFVFRRSYSMYFLSQFGPDYAVLAPVGAPPEVTPTP